MKHGLIVTALLFACDPDEAPLAVAVYGEEYIEAGIPAEAFADGWTVEFDRFLISVGELSVARAGAEPALVEPQFQVLDLAKPSDGAGHPLAAGPVPYGRYDEVGFVVGPAADAVAGNVEAGDVDLMVTGGYSLYVVGHATRGDETRRFTWGFTTRTRYAACASLAEVSGAAEGQVELTIHGDHLFYDDLFSAEPSVRFDLIADADRDADGDISQEELLAVDLRPLPNYQVGSTDIVDLWRFIEQQTTTLGHIDGEGHCDATREP